MTSLDTVHHNLTHALRAVPTDEPVLTKVEPGRKKPSEGKGWNKRENLVTGDEASQWANSGGNVGIRLGLEVDGRVLMALDVEEDGGLPDAVTELVKESTVAVWTSPHGGRNRLLAVTKEAFALLDDVGTKVSTGDNPGHDLELLTNGQALLPGSVIDHKHCRSSKPCQPSDGCDMYEHVSSKPDATALTTDDAREVIDLLGLDSKTTCERLDRATDWDGDLPEYDEKLADVGEAVLRSLQKESTPAFKLLSDWLRGGTRGYEELLKGEFGIDRSLQELMALTRLYEACRYDYGMEDEERALAVTRAKFEKYIRDNQFTDDGQRRKWLTAGESYREERLRRAAGDCDRGRFERFLNRTKERKRGEPLPGERAYVTDKLPFVVLELVAGCYATDQEDSDPDEISRSVACLHGLDLDPEKLAELLKNPPTAVQGLNPPSEGSDSSMRAYPTKAEVEDACRILDDADHVEGEIEAEYGNALSDCVQEGNVKLAFCPSRPNGERYVYYPATEPDPEEARCVKSGGEKREPVINEAATPKEARLMTDGGTPTEETMSTTRTTKDPNRTTDTTEDELRERTEDVVVSRTNRGRVMHLPDEESEEDTPLCGTADRGRGWVRKDTACYPPGHKDWCNRCAEKLHEQDEAEERASSTGTPGWLLTGDVEAGNALQSEWG